jgi:glycosyltransferase involved in cell wall biosynthesis
MSPAGYLEPVVEKLRSLPNVDYRGHVSPAVASEVIADAAVLLSTSDEEGFPNVFLQAWSSGTPVISLNIDPGDVIDNMGLGIVSRSVERAITDTMFLLDSAHRRDDIAARARCYVTENHSESAVTTTFDRALGVLS